MSTASVPGWSRLKNSAKTREPLYMVMIQNWAVLFSASPTTGVLFWSSGASAWTARPRNTRGTLRTRCSRGATASDGHGRPAEAQRATINSSSSRRGRGHGISLELWSTDLTHGHRLPPWGAWSTSDAILYTGRPTKSVPRYRLTERARVRAHPSNTDHHPDPDAHHLLPDSRLLPTYHGSSN